MDNFSIEKKLETAYFAHIGAINLPGYFYCSDRKNIYKYKPATNTKELVLGLKNLEHDQERISSNKNFVIAGSKTDKRRYVIKASSAKVIGWLDNSIPYMDPGFDNGTIIIGRLDGEMENKYFDLYYNNLASKQSIEINQHLFKLTNYHHHLKRFVFYNMVFDLEPEVFYHAENQHNETFREPVFGNIDNTEFITCLKTSQHGFSSAHFTSILSGNKQSVVPNPTITGIRLLEYLPEQKKWRIDTQEEIIIFNTDYGTEVSRCPIPMERGYADVSSCLKYGVNCKKGALYIFSLFTGDVLSKMNLYEGFEDMKRTQPKYSNAFFLQNTILVLYFDMVQSSEYLNIVETDYNLNIIREDKLQVEVAEPSGNTLGNMIVNKQKDKLLLEYNTNTYLIDIQDFSCKKIEITEEPSTLLEKQGKFSNDGKYAMIRKKENNYIYDVLKDEIRGRIPVDSSSRKDNYLFSPDTNLLIVGGKYYTTFYQLVPFLRIATMYIDSKEKFLIKTLPDQTSPNGWFYTNAPDKINVIKTKADGTEPELLPIDDEERQAFIKHHNRKDIVMNKLFKPGKYAEFAKLNASAEDFAKQDMAIELSKVEQKKLEDRT